MEWQQLTSLIVVAVTAVLVVRSQIKQRRRASLRACGSDCGCAGADILSQGRTAPEPGHTSLTDDPARVKT
jgi:hypothetical protein